MLPRLGRYLLLYGLLSGPLPAAELALQPLIDAAAPGDWLQLPPGHYHGPAVIDKPLTLDGGGEATLDGGGAGTVLTINTDGARVSNLRISGSGDRHNNLDAGIRVSGQFNVIKDNVLDDVLFGIVLHQSDHAIVRRNRIRSKSRDLAQRGDGIRVWYSAGNRILQNRIEATRDLIVMDSRDNLLAGNRVEGGRYSLHVVNSERTRIEDNRFVNNEAGIFALKANGLQIRGNLVAEIKDVTGVGIGLKESSSAVIENNRVLNVTVGIALDLSPEDPELANVLRGNLLAYNLVGIQFLSDRGGNRLSANRFLENYIPVAVRNGGGAMHNRWAGNRWSDYAGFDRNDDGQGDTPYEHYVYADRLWLDLPAARFFVASPGFSLLDFLERLAPFSEPRLMVRDERPLLRQAGEGGQERWSE